MATSGALLSSFVDRVSSSPAGIPAAAVVLLESFRAPQARETLYNNQRQRKPLDLVTVRPLIDGPMPTPFNASRQQTRRMQNPSEMCHAFDSRK